MVRSADLKTHQTMKNRSSYIQKLRSPKWQKKRLQILERDKWKCVSCGRGDINLQVHHIYYEKGVEPWAYKDSVYQTLCERCHEKRQAIVDDGVNAIKSLVSKLPTKLMDDALSDACEIAFQAWEKWHSETNEKVPPKTLPPPPNHPPEPPVQTAKSLFDAMRAAAME